MRQADFPEPPFPRNETLLVLLTLTVSAKQSSLSTRREGEEGEYKQNI